LARLAETLRTLHWLDLRISVAAKADDPAVNSSKSQTSPGRLPHHSRCEPSQDAKL